MLVCMKVHSAQWVVRRREGLEHNPGKFVSVIPENAGIHGPNNPKGILPPWTPDRVRGDQSTTSGALDFELYALRLQPTDSIPQSTIDHRPSTQKDSYV